MFVVLTNRKITSKIGTPPRAGLNASKLAVVSLKPPTSRIPRTKSVNAREITFGVWAGNLELRTHSEGSRRLRAGLAQEVAFLTRSRSVCAFIVHPRDQRVQICIGRLWLSNVGRGLFVLAKQPPTKATRSLRGAATPVGRAAVQTAP